MSQTRHDHPMYLSHWILKCYQGVLNNLCISLKIQPKSVIIGRFLRDIFCLYFCSPISRTRTCWLTAAYICLALALSNSLCIKNIHVAAFTEVIPLWLWSVVCTKLISSYLCLDDWRLAMVHFFVYTHVFY